MPATPPESDAPLDTSPADLAVLNRVSWGVSTADAQTLAAHGLAQYLNEQLHPSADDGLPPEAQDQIAAMRISRESLLQINDDIRQLRQAARASRGETDAADARKAYQQALQDLVREASTRSLLRDLYSRNQLKEQLTWFWLNHFNVSRNKAEVRALVADYEETAIRPHVLGKFRDLLTATMVHPAMLEYLDNFQNAAGHINENYAREIMELHTMGVDSGYTQKDVQELARILTGLGINPRAARRGEARFPLRTADTNPSLAAFMPARHDFGDKIFLGTPIKGDGRGELEKAADMLSAAPATARYVSRELAQFFCCDAPPDALIDAMAATFRSSDGDIAAVLKTLFTAPAFQASLGAKFKDPIHYAVSAVRAAYGNRVIATPQPLLNWLTRMGEPLYGHETPDGYPLTEASWSGPGQMETRFEIARAIGTGPSGLYQGAGGAPLPAIQETRYYRAIAPTLSATTATALAQAKNSLDRNMLFLSSPEFMHR